MPGGPPARELPGGALAGRWLSTLGALVARSAHEVNNALNGAVVNLEVVRLRARAGTDGAAAAPFAETAAGELERSAAMVGALVALTRAPREGAATTDVREIVRHATALAGPALAQHGWTLAADLGSGSMGTDAPPIAVRLGVVAALLAAFDLAPPGSAAELAGVDPAREPAHRLRCTLRLEPGPTLRLGGTGGPPSAPISFDAGTVAVLHAAGLELFVDDDGPVLRCPPA